VADAAFVAGYVEAEANRPSNGTAINPPDLSEERDRVAIVGGSRFARRPFATSPPSQFIREETLPGNDVQTDDEFLDYARRTAAPATMPSCNLHDGFAPDGDRRANCACTASRPYG
jgi:hypothetical protein